MNRFFFYILNFLKIRIRIPFRLSIIILNFFKIIYKFYRHNFPLENTERFANSINFPSKNRKYNDKFSGSIELIYVATEKDFDILPTSILFAKKSLKNYRIKSCTIAVPDHEFVACKRYLSKADLGISIHIRAESSIIEDTVIKEIKDIFKNRYGWILQQLLKFHLSSNSTSEAVLIVDSDTLLLRGREWVNNDGRQSLMPVEEFNSDYYEFLSKLNVCNKVPLFTFVSHHMLIQPRILREIMNRTRIFDVHEMWNAIKRYANHNSFSSICVDYEFYAQYLHAHFPEKVSLVKWSNVSVSRRFFNYLISKKWILTILSIFYNSVSFHSWS